MLQILKTCQFLRDGLKRVVIENQVSGLFQFCKRLGQGAELVLWQVQAFATKHTNIVWEFLDAIARQQDVFYLSQAADIPSFQVQFVEIQVDFFKTIQRTNPSGNVFDLVAFQIQSLQMLAMLDARRNPVKTTVGQWEYLYLIVFRLWLLRTQSPYQEHKSHTLWVGSRMMRIIQSPLIPLIILCDVW